MDVFGGSRLAQEAKLMPNQIMQVIIEEMNSKCPTKSDINGLIRRERPSAHSTRRGSDQPTRLLFIGVMPRANSSTENPFSLCLFHRVPGGLLPVGMLVLALRHSSQQKFDT
jgi:hypothetical protein